MQPQAFEQDGFLIRSLHCPQCGHRLDHPGDLRDYADYLKIRGHDFNVKLRMVGNSFCVSIPKEIVSFLREFHHDVDDFQDLVRLHLEKPGKVSLFFVQRNVYNPQDIGEEQWK